ncbi:MAG TPA: hypothetical protein EYP60_05790 [bacterium (Candidatus Stahlbacteria)]|nr:hypothetical protein [Candidatus Stahlbacteria bacterium]
MKRLCPHCQKPLKMQYYYVPKAICKCFICGREYHWDGQVLTELPERDDESSLYDWARAKLRIDHAIKEYKREGYERMQLLEKLRLGLKGKEREEAIQRLKKEGIKHLILDGKKIF